MQLRINNLDHAYGATKVLESLNLEVELGESVALLGPSGCGKTTLLRTIAGLDRPLAGEIFLGDRLVTSQNKFIAPEQRKVGMVFQDWALFPHLNVRRNVAFGLARSNRNAEAVAEVLDLVGLAGFEDRMPAELSGGQQQRVALARALAPRPQILLLDEPFSNLDSSLRATVRTEVRQLLLELGITTLLVTHDQDEAFVMGDRVGVLHEGALAQVGTPAELYNHPVDRFVANFVGTASWLSATADGDSALCQLGELPLTQPATGAVEVMMRPEQLAISLASSGSLANSGGSASSAPRAPAPKGTVSVIEYYGHDIMAVVALGDRQVRVRCEPDLALMRGDEVYVSFVGTEVTQFAAPGLAVSALAATADETVVTPSEADVVAEVDAALELDGAAVPQPVAADISPALASLSLPANTD